MLLIFKNVLAVFTIFLIGISLVFSNPAADSAGIIPLKPGYAYGGIPYGSVSGRLSEYYENLNNYRSSNGRVPENNPQYL